MTYEIVREFAASWGLLATVLLFLILVGWALRPGSARAHKEAAEMIFKDSEDGR